MSTSGASEGSKMKKRAYYAVGLALTALTMTGCATASAASEEPTAAPATEALTTDEIERAAIPSAEFASEVGPVLESFPNDYAFFYFDSNMQPVIGFAGKAVPAVIDAVASTGQRAQIIENAGFTDAEYTATADRLADDLYTTWPRDVYFPMIGPRPDLGVGVIGAILITEDGTSDVPGSIEVPTRLLDKADVELPFSIQIDDQHVFGPGTAAASPDSASAVLDE